MEIKKFLKVEPSWLNGVTTHSMIVFVMHFVPP